MQEEIKKILRDLEAYNARFRYAMFIHNMECVDEAMALLKHIAIGNDFVKQAAETRLCIDYLNTHLKYCTEESSIHKEGTAIRDAIQKAFDEAWKKQRGESVHFE